MLVDLRTLKSNPMRDFAVDPMDEGRIDVLCDSIREDGFWGGVVCRRTEAGEIEIGAGHHRVAAAIRAGLTTAEVCVRNGDMDDAAMVRVYARENATQRGNSGTAQAGSVASAVRFIAKAVLTGAVSGQFSGHSADVVSGQISGEKGIGREVIVEFLGGVPGINGGTVKQALANLKASGDYARIIAEVRGEIERENAEALEALAEAEREQERIGKEREEAEERQRKAEADRKEAAARARGAREETERKRAEEAEQRAGLEHRRAEEEVKLVQERQADAAEGMKKFAAMKKTRDTAAKAVAVAESKPITFDFEGVARHLKNPHQIDVFRRCVTGQGIAPYLAVNKQADLAAHLVKLAEDRDVVLSGAFIKENVVTLVLDVKAGQRREDKEAKDRLMREDARKQMRHQQEEFSRGCRCMVSAGTKIGGLVKEWPEGLPILLEGGFRSTLERAKKAIDELLART